jgi:hypothetical protein
MESAPGLIATLAALASALAMYLASPNRGWQPGAGRAGLRAVGGALALVSLGGWIAELGVGAGLCAMLATWMLALVALPYLAWWTNASPPADAHRSRAVPLARTSLESD